MAEEYVSDRLSLVLYLAAQMTDAVDDYLVSRKPVPSDLYDRFLGWDKRKRSLPSTPRTEAGPGR